MKSESLPIYEHWDLTQPISPLRSRLYSLQPIGIGTPQVESLTGYIARLADTHCVSPGTLIANEFLDLIKQPQKHSYLHQVSRSTETLNGTGQMAWDMVRALERLTLRDDLQYLTLVRWSEVLSVRGLLRHARTWCPACYEEWKVNKQTIYEPLLWNLECVSICLEHKQKLSFQCQHCKRQLPMLAWHSRPGFCSKCQNWLGTTSEPAKIQTVSAAELEWQAWVINNVGQLLAQTSCLTEIPIRESVARAISISIAQTTQGNIAEFARKLGMLKSAVWQWQSGAVLPQLQILLKICQALKLSLLEFFFNPERLNNTNTLTAIPKIDTRNTQRLKRKVELPQLQQFLETALAEEPPHPMETVAKRLGFKARFLRRHFPEICSAISVRYLSHRQKIGLAKVEQSCQEVRVLAVKLYNEGINPTRSYISQYLSKPAYFRDRSVVAALEAIRKELGLEN